MYTRRILLVAVIAMALFVPLASAQNTEVQSPNSITVLPFDPIAETDGGMALRSIGDTIFPGQSTTISKYVPPDMQEMTVYLDWSGHQHPGIDSLRLTVYQPESSAPIGRYYDNADGRVNEKISLSLSDSPSLPSGTWTFIVYGDDVPTDGTPYTLNIGYTS